MKQQDCGWGADHEAHPHPGLDNTQCPGRVDGEPVAPAPKKKCARWCGRGCTQAEYDAAREAARALAARLGPGWKGNVWENLGWHYQAVSRKGFVKVNPVIDGNQRKRPIVAYTCFIGEKNFPGGRYAENGKTPEQAIKNAAALAAADYAALGEWLKDAS